MKTLIPLLRDALAQPGAAQAGPLLAQVVQSQHPASSLSAAAAQQFRCCCARLVQATPAPSFAALLLAADVCFNYAYQIPRGRAMAPVPCPRHPLP